ncbi:hypothetical protein DYB26_008002 [Aphanomyces astaci]|uniref:Uncharacterized protein n=1 Tax=Aphanomyces astaci TaxID=112090 RepID=A0A418EE95_APHAT|nr:hypothetical protein DYB26_008002 [Aphanomyces astaci]
MGEYVKLVRQHRPPNRFRPRTRHESWFLRYTATRVGGDDADNVELHPWHSKLHLWQLASLQFTSLHEACLSQQVAATKEVLVNRRLLCSVDPLKQDSSGCTALHVSAKGGFIEGCVLLLDANSSNQPVDMIEALLLCADATGRTALHWSVRNKHAAVASYLLQSAALVGVVVELLQMSLHDVAQHTVELKTLKLLVPRPLSSPQLQSSTATSCDTVEPIASPLAIALVARSYDIADLLLQYGANITVR